jgi:hypothetical protein
MDAAVGFGAQVTRRCQLQHLCELGSLGNTSLELGIMVQAIVAMKFLESIAPSAANGTVVRKMFQAWS